MARAARSRRVSATLRECNSYSVADSSFCSWWTVLFCILYIIAFFFRFMGFFASIASHVVWVFVTCVQKSPGWIWVLEEQM